MNTHPDIQYINHVTVADDVWARFLRVNVHTIYMRARAFVVLCSVVYVVRIRANVCLTIWRSIAIRIARTHTSLWPTSNKQPSQDRV